MPGGSENQQEGKTMQLKIKLAALAMAGGSAALVLAAAPAMASSHAAGKPVSAPESANGVIHGKAATANNPTIPVSWAGLVSAHGVFAPTGAAPKKGQDYTFTTSAGKLTVVVTARPANNQTSNPKTCYSSYTTDVDFAAVGSKSTGKFAGASGSGAVEVNFAGYGPKYTSGPKKGQCNTSPNAPELAKGAVASFLLSAALTTP
jgi:hypothetical protein